MAKKTKTDEKRTADQRVGALEKMMATPQSRLLLEQAAVLWEEVEAAGETAKDGEILDGMETTLMSGGRAFLRAFLENAIAQRVAKLQAGQTRICEKENEAGKVCGGDLRHRGSKKKR